MEAKHEYFRVEDYSGICRDGYGNPSDFAFHSIIQIALESWIGRVPGHYSTRCRFDSLNRVSGGAEVG